MKIVVTGGSGFIGRALITKLIGEGHDVVLLSRNPDTTRLKIDKRASIQGWDGKSVGPWEAHVDGSDAVINFAGEPLDARRWSRQQKNRIINSRVNGTSALVKAIENAQREPPVFISASGVGYYGPVDHGTITEDFPRGKDFLSETTYEWEKAARGVERLGVRLVILRVAVVLGDDGGALRKLLIPFKLFVGGPLGSGRQWFPWVHRDDLIDVIMFVPASPNVVGPVNVAAPGVVTMEEFCSTLGQVLHRPSWIPVPGFALKLLLGEMSGMVLTGQCAVPAALERYGYKFKFRQLASALSDILK